MVGVQPTSGQGENWSQNLMAVTEIVSQTTVIIDLDDPPTGHRLTELLQALTGCSIERAELAISDPTPAGPASPDEALTSMARAMVALKSRSEAAPPPPPPG
jgi:hypothetical protein